MNLFCLFRQNGRPSSIYQLITPLSKAALQQHTAAETPLCRQHVPCICDPQREPARPSKRQECAPLRGVCLPQAVLLPRCLQLHDHHLRGHGGQRHGPACQQQQGHRRFILLGRQDVLNPLQHLPICNLFSHMALYLMTLLRVWGLITSTT